MNDREREIRYMIWKGIEKDSLNNLDFVLFGLALPFIGYLSFRVGFDMLGVISTSFSILYFLYILFGNHQEMKRKKFDEAIKLILGEKK